jgi:hypothetical protein
MLLHLAKSEGLDPPTCNYQDSDGPPSRDQDIRKIRKTHITMATRWTLHRKVHRLQINTKKEHIETFLLNRNFVPNKRRKENKNILGTNNPRIMMKRTCHESKR